MTLVQLRNPSKSVNARGDHRPQSEASRQP